jgi:micrococcal nuclease
MKPAAAGGFVLACALAVWIPTTVIRSTDKQPETFTGTVTHVADGDTIRVEKRTIRLLGVDTPETHDPRKPVQCWGPQAAAFTTSWATGRTATVRTEPSSGDTTDRYGRTLGYVTVRHQDLGGTLLRKGFARVYVFRGRRFGKLAHYTQLELNARTNGVGRWSHC